MRYINLVLLFLVLKIAIVNQLITITVQSPTVYIYTYYQHKDTLRPLITTVLIPQQHGLPLASLLQPILLFLKTLFFPPFVKVCKWMYLTLDRADRAVLIIL